MAELNDAVEEVVTENASDHVLEDSISDANVITVPIDATLSVSGEAADAYATGQAIAEKLSASDLHSQLSVNGKNAGTGDWIIVLNGDNIPAQDDDDSESVADALSRIESVAGGAAQAVEAEVSAREAADEALNARVAILESRVGVYIDVTNITYPGLIGQTHTVEDSRITANWFLASWQFYTGTTIADADATGEVLADLNVETGTGFVNVTVGEDFVSGCSCRILLMAAGLAGGV